MRVFDHGQQAVTDSFSTPTSDRVSIMSNVLSDRVRNFSLAIQLRHSLFSMRSLQPVIVLLQHLLEKSLASTHLASTLPPTYRHATVGYAVRR